MHEALIALLSAVTVAVITQGGQYLRERKARKETKTDTKSEHEKLVDDAIIAIMHDILYTRCESAIGAGGITVDELTNIEMLYVPYHKLGGNGTGTALYKRVLKLPITSDN